MTVSVGGAASLRVAIFKTLLYADIFDFPLSAAEISHYLIEYRATAEDVQAALVDDPWLAERISRVDDLVCLAGREASAVRRRQRHQAAQALWPTALWWGRVLAQLPFVRAVMVTGALAVNNPQQRDDIDYLIITQAGRLWLTRALTTTIVRLAALRRVRLCPNYLLAETALALEESEHNLFAAHELAQMTPLYGQVVYRRMRDANPWADTYLPQAGQSLPPTVQATRGGGGSWLKRGAERVLAGRLGQRLEAWVQARKVAQLYREAPSGADRPQFSSDVCKGHFDGHGRRILNAYAERLAAHGLTDRSLLGDFSESPPTTNDRPQPYPTLPIAIPGQNGHDTVVPMLPSGVNGRRSVVSKQPSALTIGFDATTLCGDKTGVGYYTSNLLSHLLVEGAEHDYLLLSNRPIEGAPGGRPLPTRYAFPNRTIWMQTVLPQALRIERPTLCHFTNSIAPIPTTIPTVVTIHDMTLSLFPRLHPLRKHLVMRPFIPLVAQQADALITVSKSAKNDIVRLLKVPPEKVHVIYEAAAACFQPVSQARLAEVRATYGLRGRYILYVGTIEPRKNLVRLIEAFARLRERGLPHQLLLVGQPGWDYKPIYQRIADLSLQDKVIFTGYVPSDDLVALYNLAEVFAFPSLYEGFGLPIVEAMACGTPVVTTHASSLGEIAGSAALTVDPFSVDELTDALENILTQASLAQSLRDRGLARAGQLSWAETARQTLAVYRQALATRQAG